MRVEPTGPSGYPVVGNAVHFARNPQRFLTACHGAYGDVVNLSFGRRQVVSIADPELIKRVLVTRADRFSKARFRDDAIEALLGDGLLLSEGDLWRERRGLVQPAFAPDRLNNLDSIVTRHTAAMLDEWEQGDIRDLHTEIPRLTLQIIVEAMFGVTLADSTADRIQSALVPVAERFEPDVRRMLRPDWVPTEENRHFRASVSDLEGILDQIVEERRGKVSQDADLLSMLLAALEDPDVEFDRGDLRDELLTMLLAGHDTTALVLIYAWHSLSGAPDVDARLGEEVRSVLDGEQPSAQDLEELRCTERILEESMRLYPPVYTLFREPAVDVRIGDLHLPAGSIVMLPQWVVHRDARWFDEPTVFDPNRWSSANTKDRPRFAYFPFGGGPRACIGRGFSLLEGQLILAMVADRFRLERTTDEPLSFRSAITMHPDGPLKVTVNNR